jgi:hypothetical protein
VLLLALTLELCYNAADALQLLGMLLSLFKDACCLMCCLFLCQPFLFSSTALLTFVLQPCWLLSSGVL